LIADLLVAAPGLRTIVTSWLNDLPEIRHEAMPHLLRIFSVPRQVVLQKLLLVEDSPDQHRRRESENREAPPRAERERYAYDHNKHSRIHRMPYKGVRACRYDLLAFKCLDCRASEAIFPEH